MSKVEVLCPNGYRVSVNVSSNTKIFKILEEACLKQGFLPINAYELKHGRKSLEMASTFDKSGLINHSKLELLPLKDGWVESAVEVNVQTSDGVRIKREFPPQTSLYDILSSFEGENKTANLCTHSSLQPVLIYVNEHFVGEFELKNTTLKSLGLFKGRILFRHMFREVDGRALKEIEERIIKERERMNKLLERAEEKKRENEERERSVGAKRQVVEESMEVVSDEKHPLNRADDKHFKEQNSQKQQYKPPIQQQQQQQQQVTTQQQNQQQQHTQHTIQENLSSSPFSFQPHTSTQPHPQLQPHIQPQELPPLPLEAPSFIDFKFPEATKGKEVYRNELSAYRKEEFQPCDRECVIYKLDEKMEVEQEEEIPESFYDVTESDAVLMQKRLKGKVKELSEQVLCTEEMRQRAREDLGERYARVVIRFQSAGADVVQALFMARETVNSLYKYVKELLKENVQFELYTSPPRQVLDNMTKTLLEADLVPMTIVYISTPFETASPLRQPIVEEFTTSQIHAELIVDKWLSLKRPSNPGNITCGTKDPTTTTTKDTDLKRKNKDGATKTLNLNDKGVPKWMKKGKK